MHPRSCVLKESLRVTWHPNVALGRRGCVLRPAPGCARSSPLPAATEAGTGARAGSVAAEDMSQTKRRSSATSFPYIGSRDVGKRQMLWLSIWSPQRVIGLRNFSHSAPRKRFPALLPSPFPPLFLWPPLPDGCNSVPPPGVVAALRPPTLSGIGHGPSDDARHRRAPLSPSHLAVPAAQRASVRCGEVCDAHGDALLLLLKGTGAAACSHRPRPVAHCFDG